MTDPRLSPDERGVALVSDLASTRETPFYVYDTAVIADRVRLLVGALPAGSRLFYSAKANPHPGVLAVAVAAGCGLELASPGEMSRLIEGGGDPADAIVVGPAKSDAFLAEALTAGVDAVVVESRSELDRLVALARRLAVPDCPVLLRLNVAGARGSLRMSGHQFGMARADILACHRTLAGAAPVRFAGYHGYLASQLLRATDILHNVRIFLGEVGALTREVDAKPERLDFGGGFGIPYTDAEAPLDLAELAVGLAATPGTGAALFESGRFLVGPAGALVCRVVDTKTVGGSRFVLLDGGMNSSGLLTGANAVRGLAHSVIRDGRIVAGGAASNLCGPLCTPMDRLATSVPCAAEVGDLVVWWNHGAYGYTAAPLAFLSFPPPAEILV